ncbi:hypothetical protein LBMAG53_22390 [Planctomycetota bacterium]|nr:hypothetical protein LBMAG53_22390 [Planctomycetota bacterium]
MTGQRGFTLLEMVVSIALIATILLLTLATVRLLTRTMGLVSDIREDGVLLRQGLLISLDDADYWNSAANPDPPWCARHNAEQQVDSDGTVYAATMAIDDAANKRPFRQVAFARTNEIDPTFSGLVPNPNALQPHDQRAWYRGHLFANPRAFSDQRGKFSNPGGKYSYPSGLLETSPMYRDLWQKVPGEWSPLQVSGDYSLVTHTEMIDTADPSPYVDEQSSARLGGPGGVRPNTYLNLYRTLGAAGVFWYSAPDAMLLIQRHDRLRGPTGTGGSQAVGFDPAQLLLSGSTTRADVAKLYDLGEVPWSLNVGSTTTAVTTAFTGTIDAYPVALAAVRKSLDYSQLLFAGTGLVTFFHDPFTWSLHDKGVLVSSMIPGTIGVIYTNRTATGGTSKLLFPITRPQSKYVGVDVTAEFGGYIGSGGSKNPLPTYWTLPRWSVFPDATDKELGMTIFTTYLPNLVLETQVIPLSPTGSASSPSLSNAEGAGRTMRISAFRFSTNGQDVTRITAQVLKPDGRRLLLICNPLCTDLRGARQHWGMISAGSPTPIGDVYR